MSKKQNKQTGDYCTAGADCVQRTRAVYAYYRCRCAGITFITADIRAYTGIGITCAIVLDVIGGCRIKRAVGYP